MELAPGAKRAYDAALELGRSLRAVPRHEELHIEQQDGWMRFLTRYQYRPLTQANEIRLLRLHPWSSRLKTVDHVMPRCELVHTTLDGDTEYAAISYTWGKLDEYSPILINEGDCLAVTNSLFQVLCELSLDKTRDFWVDQICIDQYNLAERSQQVQMMGGIFGKAIMTFVWLGMPEESSQSAFDLIEALAHSNLPLTKALHFRNGANHSHLMDFLSSQRLGSETEESQWVAIQDLSKRPWFSRLWTFQEAVTSKDIVFLCGKYSRTHDDLLRAFYLAEAVQGHRSLGMANTELTRVQRSHYLLGKSVLLLDLLLETSQGNYNCTLPHDRIYALLALQDRQQRCRVPVDYSQSTQSLYTEIARFIISNTQNLRLLHRRRFGALEGLPSWVPDWNCENSDLPINDGHVDFSCSKKRMHIFEESSPLYLLTRGNIVAKIIRVAAHRFADYEREYSEGNVRSWLGHHGLIPLIAAELNKRSDLQHREGYIKWLIAKTVTCGRFQEKSSLNFTSGNIEDYSDLFTKLQAFRSLYFQSLAKCGGRRLAVLDKYPLGLVPDFTKPGDLVCVLHGSSTPMVLRRVENDFECIGECYVHGIMYGEAVDWLEGNKILLR